MAQQLYRVTGKHGADEGGARLRAVAHDGAVLAADAVELLGGHRAFLMYSVAPRAKPSDWITRTLAAVRHTSTAPDVLIRSFLSVSQLFELADINTLGSARLPVSVGQPQT